MIPTLAHRISGTINKDIRAWDMATLSAFKLIYTVYIPLPHANTVHASRIAAWVDIRHQFHPERPEREDLELGNLEGGAMGRVASAGQGDDPAQYQLIAAGNDWYGFPRLLKTLTPRNDPELWEIELVRGKRLPEPKLQRLIFKPETGAFENSIDESATGRGVATTHAGGRRKKHSFTTLARPKPYGKDCINRKSFTKRVHEVLAVYVDAAKYHDGAAASTKRFMRGGREGVSESIEGPGEPAQVAAMSTDC